MEKSPKQAKQRFKGQLANEMKKERESQLNMCKTKTSCIALNFLHEDPLATKKKKYQLHSKIIYVYHLAENITK